MAGCLAAAASARTLDVSEFGARPDDGLDDLAAINAALRRAARGDTVALSGGDYLISAAIRPKSGVHLVGAGPDKTCISFIGKRPSVMVSASSMSDVTLSDFTLDGRNTPDATQGIKMSKGRGHRIKRVGFRNLVGDPARGPCGIFFASEVTDSQLVDNEFANIGVDSKWGAAIRLAHGSSRNVVSGNRIANTGRGGILCNDDSSDLVIRRNSVSGSGRAGPGLGIELWKGCHRSLVEDNTIDHWLSVDGSNGVAVRRNRIGDNSGSIKHVGLELVGSRDVVFTDNVVDGGAQVGVSISNDAVKERILWAYNTIRNSATWAAQIQGDQGGARFMYFFKNTFEGTSRSSLSLFHNQGHGVRINGNCQHLVLDSNRIVANDGIGIQIGGKRVDQLAIIHNTISGNGGFSATTQYTTLGPYDGDDLCWEGNTVSHNAAGSHPLKSVGFAKNRLPSVSIAAPRQAATGQSVRFSFVFVDDGSVGRMLWDFGEGLPDTNFEPRHVYKRPGNYRVTLVVWDDGGRAAHDECHVVVE